MSEKKNYKPKSKYNNYKIYIYNQAKNKQDTLININNNTMDTEKDAKEMLNKAIESVSSVHKKLIDFLQNN